MTVEDTNELVTIGDGMRESKVSWLEVLRDLNARGLTDEPLLSAGNDALGFWAALDEVYSNHPAAALLGTQDRQCSQRPASISASESKAELHEIWMASTRADPVSGM